MAISLSLLDDLAFRSKSTVEAMVTGLLARAPRRPRLFNGGTLSYYMERAVREHRAVVDNMLTRDTLYGPAPRVPDPVDIQLYEPPPLPCQACAPVARQPGNSP